MQVDDKSKMKRIVPCLDIRGGKVVKGVNFTGIKELADPVELAEYYNSEGADELVFYDITASTEGRKLFADLMKKVLDQIKIPLAVGGGVNTVEDFRELLELGASKISINSGAIKNPQVVAQAAKEFGSDKIVLAMDVKRVDGKFNVFCKGGTEDTGIDAVKWAVKAEQDGAGELVINSIDTDGVKQGFDMEMLRAISDAVSIPIVASGGAGCAEDFVKLFKEIPEIDAGLAASIFHTKTVRINEVKKLLNENNISVNVN